MTEPNDASRIRRKLAAILAADVVGYSKLTAIDEEGTARMLIARRELADALIERHGGRIANTAGDSIIAEFASSVEAVRAALEIQEAIRTQNLDIASDRQVQFRIGINVGDVIQQGDDLLGDGVNVAARLEGLAPPGGICLSGEVHDQIQGKLSLGFQSVGARRLKNIGRRIRAYRVVPETSLSGHPLRRGNRLIYAGVIAGLVVAGAVGFVHSGYFSEKAAIPSIGATPTDLTEAQRTSQLSGFADVVAEGQFDGRKYQAILTWGGSWEDADADAKWRGGHLASITSEAENEFVYGLIAGDLRLWNMFEDGQAFGPWIGLYQPPGAPEPDGGWAWVDGEAVTYKNFSPGQPNNFGGDADVVRFHNQVHEPSPYWDDASTTRSSARGYVMEFE